MTARVMASDRRPLISLDSFQVQPEAHGERGDLQGATPRRLLPRKQRFSAGTRLSRKSIMLGLSTRTSPSSSTSVGTRISGFRARTLSASPKTDHGSVLEGQPVQLQGNGDAPHEGGIVLADQDHLQRPGGNSVIFRVSRPRRNASLIVAIRRTRSGASHVTRNALQPP
jgi:hypothetical protein